MRRIERAVRAMGFVVTSGVMLAASPAGGQLPYGWRAIQRDGGDYTVSSDGAHHAGGQGTSGVTIKANVPSPSGSAVLVQSIRADDYRGKRVRLVGYVKTAEITEGSGAMWMQVEGEGTVQRSDFMQDRALHGTNDWTRAEIVLDVPQTAVGISYGAALDGSGQLWIDDLALEVVDAGAAITGREGGLWQQQGESRDELAKAKRSQEARYRRAPAKPINLDFRSRW